MSSTTGPVALVSGAGRGIGAAVAHGLASAGWSVALLARSADQLATTAQACAAAGAAVLPVAADVTDPDAVARAVARTVDELGEVSVLVNAAGTIESAETTFAKDDVADIWRVIEVNLRGPLLLTHAVLPAMIAAGRGTVISISSGAAHRASPSYTGYGISKGALSRLTRLVHAQHHGDGIRIFDLAPGVVATAMTAAMPVHADREQWTPVEATVELAVAMADGTLDAVAGRLVRAGTDTVDSLLAAAPQIVRADARVIDLVRYGPDDPVQ